MVEAHDGNQGKEEPELRMKRIEMSLRCRRANLIRDFAADIRRSRARFYTLTCWAIAAYAVVFVVTSVTSMIYLLHLAPGPCIVIGSNCKVPSQPEVRVISAILWPTTLFLASLFAAWATVIVSQQIALFRLLRED